MSPVNVRDLDWEPIDGVEGTPRRKRLGEAVEADALGCSLYELPPGSQPWSYHRHGANEEAFYVLEGRGRLRLRDETYRLATGDYVACPAGAAGAHAIVNDADRPLRYLAVSTMVRPEVTVLPERDLVGIVPADPSDRAAGFFDLGDRLDGE